MRPAPFGWQRDVAARLVAVGVSPRTAEELADRCGTGADAREAHRVIDACDAAGARCVIPQALRSELSADQLGSLLRAAGAAEGRPLSPDALDAVREALRPRVAFERRRIPFACFEDRHANL